jgi:polysaccharide biosynthesis/export protein
MQLLAILPVVLATASIAQTAPPAASASSAPGTAMAPHSQNSRAAAQPAPDYRLHRSDILEIELPFSPEYNQTATVQPDGRIGLCEAQSVAVAGKTVGEAEVVIEHAYAGLLKQPKVSVVLKDFFKPSYYASGEIGHPGRYELRSEVTLLQALSEAGGVINERARKKEVIVFRSQGDGTYESKVINLQTMLRAKGSTEDLTILPGDIIFVPQNRSSKVQRYIPSSNMGAYVSPATF